MLDSGDYTIKQKLLAFPHQLVITDASGEVVVVAKKTWRGLLVPEYTFTGPTDNYLGKVKARSLLFHRTLNVFDGTDTSIATIKRKILSFKRRYVIEGPAPSKADAESHTPTKPEPMLRAEGNFIGHDYKISTPGGMVVATIKKKLLALKDIYNVNLTYENPFLILAIVVVIDELEHNVGRRR